MWFIQLAKYTERDEESVKSIRSLMDYNRFGPTDDAYLSDSAAIYLIPVADWSKEGTYCTKFLL